MLTTAENRCRSKILRAGAVCLFVALALEALCFGFTVDDAWIISRVAAHGAATGTYAFNLSQGPTDAVTPLGFAHLLGETGRLLGLVDPLEFWWAARVLGLVSFGVSFFVAGCWVLRDRNVGSERQAWWVLASLPALCVPAAAWAGAGMTQALVGLWFLLSSGRVERRPQAWHGFALLGVVAAVRPELLPAVVTLATVATRGLQNFTAASFRVLLAALPFLSMVLLRKALFDSFFPLAAIAKQAHLQSGIFYMVVTMLWGGLPLLLFAEVRLWRGSRPWAWIWLAHLAGLVYAGGDWMPALRLTAPLYPWLVWKIGTHVQLHRRTVIFAAPAVIFPVLMLLEQGSDFRNVTERRLALVEEGRRHLRGAEVVAATDIGWVGLSTEGTVVDLAGVTDPTIARLPGGHTSKAIYPGLFSDRNVDAWVIRAADRSYRPGDPLVLMRPVYVVDARLLAHEADVGLTAVATIPLEGTRGQYVILRRIEVARDDARGGPARSAWLSETSREAVQAP